MTALAAAGRDADAIEALSDWVRHPARFYAMPEPPVTGPWTAAIDDYARLLARRGDDGEVASWRARLFAFRRGQAATLGK